MLFSLILSCGAGCAGRPREARRSQLFSGAARIAGEYKRNLGEIVGIARASGIKPLMLQVLQCANSELQAVVGGSCGAYANAFAELSTELQVPASRTTVPYSTTFIQLSRGTPARRANSRSAGIEPLHCRAAVIVPVRTQSFHAKSPAPLPARGRLGSRGRKAAGGADALDDRGSRSSR